MVDHSASKKLRLLLIPAGLALLLMFLVTGLPTEEVVAQAQDAPVEVIGEFVLSVLHKGVWRTVAIPAYGRYPADKAVNLSGLGLSGRVWVRLTHEGDGKAYLDSMLIDGQAPRRVFGASEETGLALHKASLSDFDLIDAGNRSMIFSFDLGQAAKELVLTARIQPARIPDLPLYFPQANHLHSSIESDLTYVYSMNSVRGHLTLDGELSAEELGKPFFQVSTGNGSGHPEGTTYGWVRNDDQNLYVAIDFVPDNTMDGHEDYVKVYVKTAKGVKVFKASVIEQQWGLPGFTYTDRAAYQHKIYEFKIPFSAIGLDGVQTGDKLELAFAAYGTVTTWYMDVYNPLPPPFAQGVNPDAGIRTSLVRHSSPGPTYLRVATPTVTSRTFAVRGVMGGLITGPFTYPATHTLRLQPSRSFHEGEIIRVSATDLIRGDCPVICELIPYQWQFTAGTVATRCVGAFTDIEAGLPGVSHGSVDWGDYDRDGDVDILLTGYGSGGPMSGVYRNDDGSFVDISAGLVGVAGSAVDWGDFDNDGDLDILLMGNKASEAQPPQPETLIYSNTNGVFGINIDHTKGVTKAYDGSVAWGDYNNDGLLDFLLSGNTSTTPASPRPATILYENLGGSFGVDIGNSMVLSNVHKSAVAWGDFDRGGELDIALAGLSPDGPRSLVYFNTGDTSVPVLGINAQITPPPPPWRFSHAAVLSNAVGAAVAWGDFDLDTRLDLLLAGNNGPGNSPVPITKIYRNTAGGFIDIGAGLTGVMDGSVAWGDYDNDGDPDVALAGYDGNELVTKIYRNDGLGTFVDIGAGLPGVSHPSLAWGDFDNDHDLDLLLTGYDGDEPITRIYRNDDCADLSIVKEVDPDTAAVGEQVTYTLTFSNAAGPDALTAIGVVITDLVPGELSSVDYQLPSGIDITPTTDTFAWQVQDLAPGEGGVIVISGVVTSCLAADLQFGNMTEITASTADGDPDNNTSTITVTVLNTPPKAMNDNYATDLDIALSVSQADGVLDNDGDVNCDSLTAAWDDGPEHGAVDLSADGSFVYTPTAGYAGLDSFTYLANDGHDDSNEATVYINVGVFKVYLPVVIRDE